MKRINFTIHCQSREQYEDLRKRFKMLSAIRGGTYYDIMIDAIEKLEAGD